MMMKHSSVEFSFKFWRFIYPGIRHDQFRIQIHVLHTNNDISQEYQREKMLTNWGNYLSNWGNF